jgi:starch synthase
MEEKRKVKILFVTSEADPFIKTGGLGDVSYALPKYLRGMGMDIRVVMPKYKGINGSLKEEIHCIRSFIVPVGWRNQNCSIFECDVDGVKYYLIDNEYYFFRDDIYGHYDDGERFAFYDRAVLMMLKEINWKPDIIHCNDWQTGMIPVLYKVQYKTDPFYQRIKILYSIHNMAFQGNYDPNILEELFGLGDELYTDGSLELYGAVSFMKGGISYADEVATVSRSYAWEIQTPQFGEKMDGLLASRSAHLHGIVNGIDYSIYNPKTDPMIYKNYDMDTLEDKYENKIKLQQELGLKVDRDIPMLGIVSRLTKQKGMDLITSISDTLLQKDVQLVVLGTGEYQFEGFFKGLQDRYRDRMSANISFDNTLAHRIYAASDIFLMPSLFEPCGLGQLIALRYGSLPIVRETGGLKDTVKPYNKFTGKGNGFSFTSCNPEDLSYVIGMALNYYKDKGIWKDIIRQAMDSNNSWENAANSYKELYEGMLK